MTTPKAVFDAAVDALQREDWAAVAALCDPASLMAFKRQVLDRVDSQRPGSELTAERLMQLQPGMPREVAEYEVAAHRQASDPSSVLRVEAPGVLDVDELRAMDPTAVFAAHLSAASRAQQIERALRGTPIPPEVVEQVRNAPRPGFRQRFLGVVEDGGRMAYVVYRQEPDRLADQNSDPDTDAVLAVHTVDERALVADLARGYPELATCRRQRDGTWRLVASRSLLGHESVVFAFGLGEPPSPPGGEAN